MKTGISLTLIKVNNMANNTKTAINPTRAEDYATWYQEVIKESGMAENSVVRGCIIIKQWGCAIWENIRYTLDNMIKETGHENVYFPMFIPLSFMQKEASHIEGFAKECAVVTHRKLETDEKGNLIPSGELEEPLVIRPTSEVVIAEAYSRWINSYRDLPLLCNQWANVVRWEMRTRPFLRTAEFLWQEGHTAHATKEEAEQETLLMLEVYRKLFEDHLAIPVYTGFKTENEKFPGADVTYCLEAMMQDIRALQIGTSHFLGQNFAKAFDIMFQSYNEKQEYVWTTSWGVSTRIIGGLIMVHSDDDGLVLPPRIAPLHIIIIPIIHKVEDENLVRDYCEKLADAVSNTLFDGKKTMVKVDYSDKRHGAKNWDWIKKGVPLRIEIGRKEVDSGMISYSRRDQISGTKHCVKMQDFVGGVPNLLTGIQHHLLDKAKTFMNNNVKRAKTAEEFYSLFANGQRHFVLAHWAQNDDVETRLKEELKVTPRCIPLRHIDDLGQCIFTGKEACPLTLFAMAY